MRFVSPGALMFEEFLSGLEYFAESLRNFRGQLDGMLELYFEPLSRRSADSYAKGYTVYFTETAAAGELPAPNLLYGYLFCATLSISG